MDGRRETGVKSVNQEMDSIVLTVHDLVGLVDLEE